MCQGVVARWVAWPLGSPEDLRLYLARSPPFGVIRLGSIALGLATATASGGTQLASHPLFGAELAFQEGRHVEIGIELRPVQAKPGGGNLDLGQSIRCGVGETFDEMRRNGELEP